MLLGDGDTTGSPILSAALMGTAPGAVVVAGTPGSDHPLLAGRILIEGRDTAYVCRHLLCDAPTADPAALAATLGARTP